MEPQDYPLEAGFAVKLAYDIEFTSYRTGRSWELPEGRTVSVARIQDNRKGLPTYLPILLETFDKEMFAHVSPMAVTSFTSPLMMLAACAEDEEEEEEDDE